MNLKSERKIIDEAKLDSQAFGKLYREYANDVYRYTYSLLGNSSEAEDVTSEAFFRALSKIDKFESGEVSIKYWIISIARHVVYESYRKPNGITLDNEMQLFDVEAEMAKSDPKLQDDIQKALMLLPELTREVIVLKVWEEMKFSEISEMTGLKESAVKMQYYRGLENIREELEKKKYDKSHLTLPAIAGLITAIGNSDQLMLTEVQIGSIGQRLLEIGGENINFTFFEKMSNLPKFWQYAIYSGVATMGVVAITATSVAVYSQTTKNEANDKDKQIEVNKEEDRVEEKDIVDIDEQLVIDKGAEETKSNGNVKPTPETAPVKAPVDTYEVREFVIEYNLGDGGATTLSAKVPKDSIITVGGTSGAPSTKIKFSNGSELTFSLPHMAFPQTFLAVGPMIDNPSFQGMYRVTNKDNVQAYSNKISLNQSCQTPDLNVEAPCGLDSVKKVGGSYAYVVLFNGNSDGQIVADKVMSTLSVVK